MALPAALTPSRGEQGVLTSGATAAGHRTVRGWDLFVDAVRDIDQAAPSRSPHRTGRELLLPLGFWPETRSVAEVVADAEAGRTAPAVDLDAVDAAALAANPRASATDVVVALQAARDELAAFLRSRRSPRVRALVTASPLGPLPVLTLLHAMPYRLAVAALDLEPCGATPTDELLEIGVAALVDTTGALAAREGVPGSITAVMPGAVWGFGADEGGWRCVELRDGADPEGPSVQADARVLLDITSGRETNIAALWRDRRLVTRDIPGLLRLAPVLEQVPGIPGGAALRAAARYLGGLGRLLGRLPGLPF
jgi:hypothetical protein